MKGLYQKEPSSSGAEKNIRKNFCDLVIGNPWSVTSDQDVMII